MRKIFIICILFFATIALKAQKDIKFKRISIEHGLSQSTVNCIFQDKTGFIWIGTEDGLNRYDGYSFVIYKNDAEDTNSISDNHIRAIAQDENGNILACTSYGFNILDIKTEKFTRYFSDPEDETTIASNYVQDVVPYKGYYWLALSDGGVNRFDPETETFRRYMHNPDDNTTISENDTYYIYIESDSVFWVTTTGGAGLEKFVPQTGKFYHYYPDTTTENSVSSNFIWQIERSGKSNNYWLATSKGLDYFDPETNTFKHYRHDPDDPATISNSTVKRFDYDTKGHLWIGTDYGISVLDIAYEKFVRYNHSPYINTSLSDDHITSVFCDRQGKLWIGTYGGGLNMYNQAKEKFQHFPPDANDKNSVSHKYVWSLYEDEDGILWIGTERGLDKFDRKKHVFTNYRNEENNPKSLSANRVWCIDNAGDGFLWVGTKEGLNKFDIENETSKRYLVENNKNHGLLQNNIRRIFTDSDGVTWFGTWGDGLAYYIKEEDRFVHYKNEPGNPSSIGSNSIWEIIECKDGYLWIGGYDGGLMRFDKKTETFKRYVNDKNNPKSIAYNIVEALHEDKYGNIWVGTWGAGLDKFDKKTETFRHFTIKDGLPNNLIYAILEDDNNNLWMTTNNGLSKFNIIDETFENYFEADGLQSYEFNGGSAYKSKRTGEMFIGGIWGFNTFYPDSIKPDTIVPAIVITEMKILNQTVKINKEVNGNVILTQPIYQTDEIVLSYKDYMFAFEFAVLNFDNSEKIKYAYKMEGFDHEWRYTDEERRFASYTNLDAGKYTFRVKGTNIDGIWNEGIRLKITITPPFWETWWFRILMAVLLLGVAYAYYLNRINQFKRQQAKLEKLVAKRTAELNEMNVELEEKQEEIIQQSDALKTVNESLHREKEYTMASINYAQTIQSTILPIKDELDELFENFIIYLPKDIVSGDFYWMYEVEDTIANKHFTLIAAIDCTGHGIPGAFMSLTGYNLLNAIVREMHIYDPKEILTQLNKKIVRALRQETSDNDDGMDVCLCKIDSTDKQNIEVTFSGAVRPLIYHRKGTNEIKSIKGGIMSIGGVKYKISDFAYSNTELKFKQGDTIYLTSDGLMDQNNYKRKRFTTKRLKNILIENIERPMNEQKELLLDALSLHQGEQPQRDDITVLGIRF